jgi:hypothetical protein
LPQGQGRKPPSLEVDPSQDRHRLRAPGEQQDEHVGLVEALELVLLLARDGDGRRFQAACVRWTSRYCAQTRVADAAEAQAVLGLLTMLGGERRRQAAALLRWPDESSR